MGNQENIASYTQGTYTSSALQNVRDNSAHSSITWGPVRTAYLPSDAFDAFSMASEIIRNKKSVKISDVKILSTNKVVQVVFADGTSEKAVCDKEDTFSLETGITVCIAKKLLGGTKEYNKIIRNALKTMERNEKSKKEREDEKKRIALKRQKTEEQRRERKVKIQEEAYYRAMKRIESEKKE